MRKIYFIIALLMLLQSATSVKAHDFLNETVVEGTKYYIFNAGVKKFLNNENGLDATPVTLWTIDIENASISCDEKFLSCTRTGTNILNYKYNWTSDASENGVNKIEKGGEGYTIASKYTGSFLAANADGLTNSPLNIAPNATWVFVSEEQYNAVQNPLANVDFEVSPFSEGQFYIINPITGKYLSTAIADFGGTPALWTIAKDAENEGLYTLTSGKNKLSLTAQRNLLGAIVSDDVTTTGETASPLTIAGEDNLYTISYHYVVTYRENELEGDLYIQAPKKAEYEGNEGILAVNADELSVYGKWAFISKEEYESSKEARDAAYQRLVLLCDKGDEAKSLPMPTAVKLALETNVLLTKIGTLPDAKKARDDAYSKKTNGGYKYSVSDLSSAADKLENAVNNILDLTDTYVACKDATTHITNLPGDLSSISGMIGENVGLEIQTTKSGLLQTIQTMRLAALASVGLTSKFKAGDELTGLIQNHSFDNGDITGWNSLLGNLTTTSVAIRNTDNQMDNVTGNYYFQTKSIGLLGVTAGEQIYQPVLGLKKGDYSLKIKATSLSATKDIHLRTIAIPTDVIDLSDLSNITPEVIADIVKNIGTIVNRGVITETAKECANSSVLEEVEHQFTLEADNPILINICCGALGVEAFAADEVTLTYLGEGVVTNMSTFNTSMGNDTYYNVNGIQTVAPTKGINIQRTADGKIKKYIVK